MPRSDAERSAVAEIENLRSTVRGDVLGPPDPGYDKARSVFDARMRSGFGLRQGAGITRKGSRV